MADQGRAGTKPDQEPGGWGWRPSPEQSLALRGQPGRSAPASRQGAQGSQRGYPVTPRHVPARSPRRAAARRRGCRDAGRNACVQPACRADRVPCPVLPAEPGRCAHRARPRARSSALLRRLLDGGRGGTVAGCLAAAFRSIGRERVADDIAEAMCAAEPPSTSSAGSGRRSLGVAGAGGRSGQSPGDAEPSPCAVGTVAVSCIHRRGRPKPPTWRMRGLPEWKMDGEHRKTGAGATMNRRTREETGKGPALGPIGWTDVEWPPGNAVEIHHELLDVGDREGAAKWLADVSVDVLARQDRQRAPVPAGGEGLNVIRSARLPPARWPCPSPPG